MDKFTQNTTPLYVDLDGTFIKADMLYESLVIALKTNPLIIFMCVFWLAKGKAHLKYKLSQLADISTGSLPLNTSFHSFLIGEKEKKRKIILATASNEKYAKDVCSNFDLFDSFICSDEHTNLKGKSKLLKIQSLSERFSYAGNSSEDFIIFKASTESILVNPTNKAKKMALKVPTTLTFDDDIVGIKVWFKQLRVHQWIKNILIFVPLLVTGKFLSLDYILLSTLGFLSFSSLASATYIINDLLDLSSDRNHDRKKSRPLAAGTISIINAKIVALILLIFAFCVALSMGGLFVYVLSLYLVLTLAYSFKIKQYICMDVIALASLYTIRIIAGATILNVSVSFWLLSFSMFIFLSLAFIKRCAELKSLHEQGRSETPGRDYLVSDYSVLMSLGTSSAMLSVLMFCFYINSNVLVDQYQEPILLWLAVPALCYWNMRMWIKTHRGEMHDDPVVFSLKDKGSHVTIGFIGFTAFLAQIL
ncbi:MAG: 4-hydroxybenzoate polyprenyltransferase [Polaribacter sp.]|jgi:4-hydroxybenzoate polyprenyltransferase